jgi:hypothetical protein
MPLGFEVIKVPPAFKINPVNSTGSTTTTTTTNYKSLAIQCTINGKCCRRIYHLHLQQHLTITVPGFPRVNNTGGRTNECSASGNSMFADWLLIPDPLKTIPSAPSAVSTVSIKSSATAC